MWILGVPLNPLQMAWLEVGVQEGDADEGLWTPPPQHLASLFVLYSPACGGF